MAEQIDSAELTPIASGLMRKQHFFGRGGCITERIMKRTTSFVLAGVALVALVVGCRSSGGNEPVSATNTTSADMPATTRPVPMAGNPASVATIFDAEQPSITQTTSSTPVPQTEPLVSPSLVSPAPLVEPGLENRGTSSPLSSPAESSRMSIPPPL